jgi:hypothetical protein
MWVSGCREGRPGSCIPTRRHARECRKQGSAGYGLQECSSIGQSTGLQNRGLGVRVPPLLPPTLKHKLHQVLVFRWDNPLFSKCPTMIRECFRPSSPHAANFSQSRTFQLGRIDPLGEAAEYRVERSAGVLRHRGANSSGSSAWHPRYGGGDHPLAAKGIPIRDPLGQFR